MTRTFHNGMFTVLAGELTRWQRERDALERHRGEQCFDDMLCALQVKQHQAGRRTATIVETIYGYSVRSDNNLDNRDFVPGGRRLQTWADAVCVGIAWASEDPSKRMFYVRTSDMSKV